MIGRGPGERRTQAERDLSAALAELRGRRDQLATQYDERLRQLESLRHSLDEGSIDAKVVQDRVRQLLGDRGGVARPTRAGRTTIGMSAPTVAPSAAPTPARMAPTTTVAGATLNKAAQDIDARVGRLVTETGIEDAGDVQVEIGLLRQMRRGIARQQEDLPTDAVLLAAVMEQGEATQAVLTDLERGGSARLRRLLDYGRELIAQLRALGAAPVGVKEQLVRVKVALTQAADEPSEEQLAEARSVVTGAVVRAQSEIERRMPLARKSLLDQLFKA